ncbi:DsbA family protein [Brevundimonas sp. Root1279]|uniref:DsbA family protein n=1 Tax=Brevundimonas sp. Root1279 TaxID=1736443 RepID=UPI0006F6A963|nr:thioredoxin domain-containing protein [Brevundimonas sp. Root1279]KQW83611.1 disulfide bond formation protein DsbA [Brevundimonas sp. Root1279]
MTDAPQPTPDATPETKPSPFRRYLTGDRAGTSALAVAALALVVAVAPYARGTDFDSRVRAYLLRNPEVLQEVSDALNAKAQQQQLVDNHKSAQDITARVAANPALLAIDPQDPSFGPADAKVTVVEFFDFRCPGCKATAPEVLRLMQAHPDVRFVFKDWPILDRGPDGVSHHAARAAMAAHQQGKYLPVFQALMAEPDLSEEAIERILAEHGVALPAATAAMSGPEIARQLADIQTSATAMGLVGTPTFFVNGKASATIEPREIDKAIRAAKAS